MIHDRWTEFDLWCDDMIEYCKEQIEYCQAMEKFCGASEMLSNRVKHHQAKMKLFEIRKKHYLETGDSYSPKTEEVRKLQAIADKYDPMWGG